MRKLLVPAAIALLALGMLSACESMPTEPQAGRAGPSAEFKPRVPGSTFTYATSKDGGTATMKTSVVLANETYKGRKAVRIASGENAATLYDASNGNFMASFVDGKPKWEARPDNGGYNWPLFVGKKWTGTYDWVDHLKGTRSPNTREPWRVEAYEDVTVQAGTFKAFRLKLSSGHRTVTKWYVPELGAAVKGVQTRSARHYLGVGRTTWELVSYTRPDA